MLLVCFKVDMFVFQFLSCLNFFYKQLFRYSEAQEAANSVLQIDSRNADAIYVRGLCLYYEDNVDRAFSHFTQVLR